MRAPNRTLDLDELERPGYRRHLEELDRMVEDEAGAYLHPSKRWEYPWALERAALEPGNRVLDAGAGASIFPVYLAGEGQRVTALDRRIERRLGGAQGLTVDYVCGDLTALPLAEESYDAVFCISVIEHIGAGRVPVALEELRQVLKPGGRLLFTTDYYEDADADVWYEGEDRRFRVDWDIFDEERIRSLILDAPGFRVDGEVDLVVDWDEVKPCMLEYHGYPYTSVGVALVRE